MIDVIHLNLTLALAQLQHVANSGDEVVGAKRHLCLGHGEPEFAINAEPANAAKAVAVGVFEFFIEERSGFIEGGRIARPKALVDSHQRVFVAWSDVGAFL